MICLKSGKVSSELSCSPGSLKVPQIAKIPAGVWITLALSAASIEPIVAKFAFQSEATPFQLIFLKNTLGGLFVLPLLVRGMKSNTGGIKQMLLAGLLLFTTNSLTLISLTSISVVLLITIVTTVPALVALINKVLGRDKLGQMFWLGFCLCFLGVVLTLDYKDIRLNVAGVLLALLAALSSSIYRVRMEIICEKYSPLKASAISCAAQAALSLALLPWINSITQSTFAYGIWIGLAAVLANLSFVYAIKVVGSTKISILTMLQRPLLIVASALILKESLSSIQVIGVILVMLGINMAKVERESPNPKESETRDSTTDSAQAGIQS